MERKPNRLVKEKSPYLLQHAFNPVDWYPWSGEALKRAKNDSKPIFLSIGYSTCHWCHVFEKESFEDAQTAAFINKNFIPIKVDREERPELDAYYMAAVQTLTGGGGWPLTVFLTPDLKPFYGGTYFPKEPRYGMPSFMQVLEFVSKLWKEKRSEVVGNSEQVTKAISAGLSPRGDSEPGKPLLDEAYRAIVSSFDPEHGGFGGAPKFPLPMTLAFLLRDHFRTGRELALRSALKTLDSMMAGGIRDHIGGGFHRYSTDRHWLVPHFEKMLYDNALLARVYLEAFQATGNEGYALVARETLGWILEEMTDPEGGFYSAQDADTPEGEGVYYTWTPAEVQKVLGPKHSAAFNDAFGVTKTGNFEGRTILHFANVAALQEVDEGLKSKLYLARLKRPRPPTDTKVLTSWNGLAISAFALSGAIRGGKPHLQAAERAARFVLHKVSKDGRLQRRYAGGEAALDGTLEDYAFFVQGLLDLFEATGDPEWLEQAVRLTDAMSRDFRDEEGEGFFMTMEAAPVRIKEAYDGPTPSGNSVAALNLLRISELTGRDAYRAEAEKVLKYFGKDLEEQPSGHAAMLMALDLLLNGMREVVITSRFEGGAAEMTREVFRRFLPDKVVLVASASTYEELSRLSGLLEGRRPTSKARAYVCKDNACKLPADTVEALSVQLAEPRITV